MESPALPQVLRDKREEIAAKGIAQHRAGGTLLRWSEEFPEDAGIQRLRDQFGEDRLSRSEIFELGREAPANALARSLTFTATFVWGYPAGGRAYGNYRKALASGIVEGVLQTATEALMRRSLADAFEAFGGQIPAYRQAFFTKYFYFVDRGQGDHKDRPIALILDSRVRQAIECLRRFHDLEWEWKRPYARRYEAYCRTLFEWARALQCDPDKVERFLFGR